MSDSPIKTMLSSVSAPAPVSEDAPMTVFPVPLVAFAKTLKGTDDEIWSRLLKIHHGREKHTPVEWQALIDSHRHTPAHPGH